MGSPKGSNTTTTEKTGPTWLNSQYQTVAGRADQIGSTPYQPYQGELVAGFNPTQAQGFQQLSDLQGIQDPYINQAADYARQGAAPIANITSQDIQQYYNPYQQDVINATMGNINETNAQQQQQVKGNATLQGALGGDRRFVAQGELARQQGLASNQTLANLQSQGYQSALGAAQSQQQIQQQNANRAGQAAYTFGSLGQEALGTHLQGTGALLSGGNQQQALEQARDTANYGQYQTAQAFPYQQLGWEAGILGGLGSVAGGTTTTTGPAPNPWNTLAGLGATAAGAYAGKAAASGGRIDGYDDGGGVPQVPFGGGMPYGGAQGFVPQPMQQRFQSSIPDAPTMSGPQQEKHDNMMSSASSIGKYLGSQSGGAGASEATNVGLPDAADATAGGLSGIGDSIGAGLSGLGDSIGAGMAGAGEWLGSLFGGAEAAELLPLLAFASRGGRQGMAGGGLAGGYADNDLLFNPEISGIAGPDSPTPASFAERFAVPQSAGKEKVKPVRGGIFGGMDAEPLDWRQASNYAEEPRARERPDIPDFPGAEGVDQYGPQGLSVREFPGSKLPHEPLTDESPVGTSPAHVQAEGVPPAARELDRDGTRDATPTTAELAAPRETPEVIAATQPQAEPAPVMTTSPNGERPGIAEVRPPQVAGIAPTEATALNPNGGVAETPAGRVRHPRADASASADTDARAESKGVTPQRGLGPVPEIAGIGAKELAAKVTDGVQRGIIPQSWAGPLMRAGLTMMASRSPFLGVAAGEGGLAGMNQYAVEKHERAADEKAKTDAGYKKAQAQYLVDRLKQSQRALDVQQDSRQDALAQRGIENERADQTRRDLSGQADRTRRDLADQATQARKDAADIASKDRQHAADLASEDRRLKLQTPYPGEGVGEDGKPVKGIYQFNPATQEYDFKAGKILSKGQPKPPTLSATERMVEQVKADYAAANPDKPPMDTVTANQLLKKHQEKRDEFAIAQAKADSKRLETYRTDAVTAASSIKLLDEIESVRDKAVTGPLGPIAQAVGHAATQTMNARASELTRNASQLLKGNLSDKDVKFLEAGQPGITLTGEAGRAVSDMMRAGFERVKQRGEFYGLWSESHGGLKGVEQAWKRFVDENPLTADDPHALGGQKYDPHHNRDFTPYLMGAASPAAASGKAEEVTQNGITYSLQPDGNYKPKAKAPGAP